MSDSISYGFYGRISILIGRYFPRFLNSLILTCQNISGWSQLITQLIWKNHDNSRISRFVQKVYFVNFVKNKKSVKLIFLVTSILCQSDWYQRQHNLCYIRIRKQWQFWWQHYVGGNIMLVTMLCWCHDDGDFMLMTTMPMN